MLNSPKISTESGYANPVAQQVRNIAIVDDFLVMRSVVRRIIDKSPAFHIAGDFGSAGAILDFLADNVVDIIILDIEMPQRNGLDAIPDILKLCPAARILVLSSHCETGGAAVVKALALGACDTMEKPNNHFYAGDFSDQLISNSLFYRRIQNGLRPCKCAHINRLKTAKFHRINAWPLARQPAVSMP